MPRARRGPTYPAPFAMPIDILLEIFDAWRMLHGARQPSHRDWYNLTQVCQLWRAIIYSMPSRFHLRLYCSPGTRVEDLLPHSPPWPIVVDYSDSGRWKLDRREENRIIYALQYQNRILQLSLKLRPSLLFGVVATMSGAEMLYPALEHMTLQSYPPTPATLPVSFLEDGAPQLRSLSFTGIAIPTLPSFLLSAKHLTHIYLYKITGEMYFSPDQLVVHLAGLSQLQWLSLSFSSAPPRARSTWPRPHDAQPILFPKLTGLCFEGVNTYLQNLLLRVSAPTLNSLDIMLFNQLSFNAEYLAPFLHKTQRASLRFADNHASISVTSIAPDRSTGSRLLLVIPCLKPDWQLSSISQICTTLTSTLYTVEHLSLHFPTDPRNASEVTLYEPDPALWNSVVRTFPGVQIMRIKVAFENSWDTVRIRNQGQYARYRQFACSLLHQDFAGGVGQLALADTLPSLHTLELSTDKYGPVYEEITAEAMVPFVTACQDASRAITWGKI
ncbi:hypothetical protein BC834DRAFT_281468 [Gloeopeniophorella convolvens]|nr:hypothetical protein BC834DRAFT_281468 [Gloeopeniophorella convolvens]